MKTSLFKTALAALGVWLLSTIAALALDATSTTWLNVRDAPGTYGDVVDTLYPDEFVTIEECNPSGWCRISHEGADGWVNASYLEPAAGAEPEGVPPAPDCHFELTLGPDGPKFSIVCDGGSVSVGGGGGGGGPTEACFYDGPNYTGASFCRDVGTYNHLGPLANDRITSIKLSGGAKVRLCQNANMGPYCRDVTTNETQLGTYLNNQASSLRVYTGSLPPLKQACFFDGPNYSGDYFCMRVGQRNSLSSARNDMITSVAVFGGARARLCVNTNLAGFCRTTDTNIPVLGVFLNNKTSSLKVE